MSQTTFAPTGYTCNKIDRVINIIKTTILLLEENNIMFNTDVTSLEPELEKLRDANDALRQWGKDSQDIIEDLENQLQKADEKIEELEETIKLFSIS